MQNIKMAFGDKNSPTAVTKPHILALLKAIEDGNLTKEFSGHISLANGSINAAEAYALGLAGITYHGATTAVDFTVQADKTTISDNADVTFSSNDIPVSALVFSLQSVTVSSGTITEEQVRSLISFNGNVMHVAAANRQEMWQASIVVRVETRYTPTATKEVKVTCRMKPFTSISLSESSLNFSEEGQKTVTFSFAPSDATIAIKKVDAEFANATDKYEIVSCSKSEIVVACKDMSALESCSIDIAAEDMAGNILLASLSVSNKILPTVTIEGVSEFKAKNGNGSADYVFAFNPASFNVPVEILSVVSSNSDKIKIRNFSQNGFTAYCENITVDTPTYITAKVSIDGVNKNIGIHVNVKYIESHTPFILVNTSGKDITFIYRLYSGTSYFQSAVVNNYKDGDDKNGYAFENVDFSSKAVSSNNVTVTLHKDESFFIQSSSFVPSSNKFLFFIINVLGLKPNGDVLATCNWKMLEYACYSMFQGCTGLTQAPELPATTLASYCYQSMFSGCTGLTQAPELPATTLASYCYSNMFLGCTGLTQAPELPATAMADSCYMSMFQECTGLTQAPELPATTLDNNCYKSMFQGCTRLAQAPELPATTLTEKCYSSMFKECQNINWIKMLAIDIANNSLFDWVSGVASNGTFVKNIAATWDITGNNGVPNGWTIEYADE